MAAKLEKLGRQRASVIARLAHFEDYADSLTHPISQEQKAALTLRVETATPLLQKFESIQDQIDVLQTNDERNWADRAHFTDRYLDLLGKFKLLLGSDSNNLRSSSASPVMASPHIKLPKVELPTFNGDYTSWQAFCDSFVAMIDNNNSLSDVQKLCYLKGQLRGEPADMIKSLKTVDANYQIAFGMLYQRYNKKRIIVDNHVREILKLEPFSIGKEGHSKLRHFINILENNIKCLKSLGQPVEMWDAILMPIILGKLDINIARDWEDLISSKSSDEIPTYTEFIEFLYAKQNTLDNVAALRVANRDISKNSIDQTERRNKNSKSLVATEVKCSFCNGRHYIQACKQFLDLDVNARCQRARDLKLCINCLKKGHYLNQCKSTACKNCSRKHHTLLHIDFKESNQPDQRLSTPSNDVEDATSLFVNNNSREVLLPTAEVYIFDGTGKSHTVRALLDSGSQSNFVTEGLCDVLKIKPKSINLSVTGINNETSIVNREIRIRLKSKYNDYQTNLNCLVLKNIAGHIPSHSLRKGSLRVPPNITLADKNFRESRPIDLLIGAELFFDLLCVGQIKESCGTTFQKTQLGWVVTGSVPFKNQVMNSCLISRTDSLHEEVKRFWAVEDIPNAKKRAFTKEETLCEKMFCENTTIGTDGRFTVKIPFSDKLDKLGDSYEEAKCRFFSLERKFLRNVSFKREYIQTIRDYIQQGHMTQVNDVGGFYLPHHAVTKTDGDVFKLRVVFDGSCKLRKGFNINEVQYVGPTIQEDLFSILLRFRVHRYVITADVKQMYRQIWVSREQRKYQRILWRENTNDDLKPYELNTVTFGMSSAPFLAIRCLQEIALSNERAYPREAEIIRRDFYVDDLLSGGNSIEEVEIIRSNLSKILRERGFHLYKWKDNFTRDGDCEDLKIVEGTKVLGMVWDTVNDYFSFRGKAIEDVVTKRSILSASAQLFDPMGLITPVIITAKIIIQNLWQLKLNWDESVPMNTHNSWLKFKSQLVDLDKIKIPRFVLPHARSRYKMEIHGFCDASERAYGACLYIKTINSNGSQIHLLTSKSRVAPLKIQTLPRLELMGALLLSEMYENVIERMQFENFTPFFWTDSKITLCWIQAPPTKWKTFVANRVAKIQDLTRISDWRHVKSKDNPADIISRGHSPAQLADSDLWWYGPQFLRDGSYKSEPIDLTEMSESNNSTSLISIKASPFPFENYSTLTKLVRIVAWCLRIAKPELRNHQTLTLRELDLALNRVIKLIQIREFTRDYNDLSENRGLDRKSKILNLSPFLDNDGIIRVGGRLKNSQLPFSQRHPVLLPKGSHLTKLIFAKTHLELMHAGPNQMLSAIRQRYWPIAGLDMAKLIYHKCVKCFRANPIIAKPLMGNLPRERVTIMPPFYNVGVDYGGPILIKDKGGRGSRTTKAYLSLFVCFTTKAVHIEAVTALSTNAFLAALRRFIARRGKPKTIFSDNGTNFIGANKELQKLYEFVVENGPKFQSTFITEGITWKFIPPYSPHIGGLWEAGIKQVKNHLKRVITQSLTFEELYTVLTQVEAILNSRPLLPMSNDPNDLLVLTPAHFLIGRPYTLAADPDVTDMPVNRLDRLQFLQRMCQEFWRTWSNEYLSTLQRRRKWTHQEGNLQMGALVLLKDDNLPPSKWSLARVIDCILGDDGVVRIVRVKTAAGETTRTVRKVCPLPSVDVNEQYLDSLNN